MLRAWIPATLLTVLAMSLSALPAAAEGVDATTITCADLVQASQSDKSDDHLGAAALLAWLSGYHATEDQGTVVDFDGLKKDAESTLEYCQQNPKIGVFSASLKYMGENATEQTSAAVDLATIKCERIINTKKDEEDGLSIILMWLAGYYASYAEEKIIDASKLEKEGYAIGKACAENAQTGLVTVAEKYMQSE
jgi:hypothetical protein